MRQRLSAAGAPAHALSWDDVDRGEEKTLLAAYRDYSFEVAKLGCLPGAFEGLAQRGLEYDTIVFVDLDDQA